MIPFAIFTILGRDSGTKTKKGQTHGNQEKEVEIPAQKAKFYFFMKTSAFLTVNGYY